MTRSHRKGYAAPWSSHREIASLMGGFLVFLVGSSGHSETMISQTRHAIEQLIRLALVFLGLATPVPKSAPEMVARVPAPAHVKIAHKAPVVDPNTMILRSVPVLRHLTYIFEGKATYKGQPCPNASVLVRLIAGDRSVTKGTVTETDGSYSLQVAVDAGESDPVDWTVEAFTPDFNKVEMSGRRIVQREDEQEKDPVVFTNPVEFVLSSSK